MLPCSLLDTWKGTPITELSREKLIEAVHSLGTEVVALREHLTAVREHDAGEVARIVDPVYPLDPR
jgi:hypothetical protein